MSIKRGIVFAAGLFVVLAGSVAAAAKPLEYLGRSVSDAGSYAGDDEVPDVTDRVGRMSFLRGEVKIKRADSDDWEQATLNLPVVEGDEITTSANSRVEIQFDNYNRVRLDENGYLKITRLFDGGIALSLPQGALNARITKFNKDRAYFEIDAPGSTVAVEHEGSFRVDAGSPGSSDLQIRVTDSGEARVYSDTSGFTLKNGRSARVFLSGSNAGEWQMSDASLITDEFDRWSSDRDETIARSLKDAYYDKYYDSDIYGADDLDGNGDWVFINGYGYVWRPYSSAIAAYSGWSPYRYGQWRWLPDYGWTWVNDEPWGWATYHHGRWFYDAGNWYWSPYGSQRYSRSWWRPALVVISILNNNVCWYPLPYNYAYYNFNAYYYNHGWNGRGRNNGHGVNPTPTPPPIVETARSGLTAVRVRPPSQIVPTTGVVSMPTEQFGRVRSLKIAPLATAERVLAQIPDDRRTAPILPVYRDVRSGAGRDIAADKPRLTAVLPSTGAAPRDTNGPLDRELRTTRILGGRPPVTPAISKDQELRITENPGNTVRTGAVERPPRPMPPTRINDGTRQNSKNEDVIREDPGRVRTPVIRPPSRDTTVRETPRYETPRPRLDTNRSETPAPTRRTEPTVRTEIPRKTEPKTEVKPSVGNTKTEHKKDNR